MYSMWSGWEHEMPRIDRITHTLQGSESRRQWDGDRCGQVVQMALAPCLAPMSKKVGCVASLLHLPGSRLPRLARVGEDTGLR